MQSQNELTRGVMEELKRRQMVVPPKERISSLDGGPRPNMIFTSRKKSTSSSVVMRTDSKVTTQSRQSSVDMTLSHALDKSKEHDDLFKVLNGNLRGRDGEGLFSEALTSKSLSPPPSPTMSSTLTRPGASAGKSPLILSAASSLTSLLREKSDNSFGAPPLIPPPKTFLERQASLSSSTSSLSSSKRSFQLSQTLCPSPPPPELDLPPFSVDDLPITSSGSQPPPATSNSSNSSREDRTSKSPSPPPPPSFSPPQSPPPPHFPPPIPFSYSPPQSPPPPLPTDNLSDNLPIPFSNSMESEPSRQSTELPSFSKHVHAEPGEDNPRGPSVTTSEVMGYLDAAIGDQTFSASSNDTPMDQFSPAFHFPSTSTDRHEPLFSPSLETTTEFRSETKETVEGGVFSDTPVLKSERSFSFEDLTSATEQTSSPEVESAFKQAKIDSPLMENSFTFENETNAISGAAEDTSNTTLEFDFDWDKRDDSPLTKSEHSFTFETQTHAITSAAEETSNTTLEFDFDSNKRDDYSFDKSEHSWALEGETDNIFSGREQTRNTELEFDLEQSESSCTFDDEVGNNSLSTENSRAAALEFDIEPGKINSLDMETVHSLTLESKTASDKDKLSIPPLDVHFKKENTESGSSSDSSPREVEGKKDKSAALNLEGSSANNLQDASNLDIEQLSPVSKERIKRRSIKVEVSKLRNDMKTIRQHIKPGTVDNLAFLFTQPREDQVLSPRTKEFDAEIQRKLMSPRTKEFDVNIQENLMSPKAKAFNVNTEETFASPKAKEFDGNIEGKVVHLEHGDKGEERIFAHTITTSETVHLKTDHSLHDEPDRLHLTTEQIDDPHLELNFTLDRNDSDKSSDSSPRDKEEKETQLSLSSSGQSSLNSEEASLASGQLSPLTQQVQVSSDESLEIQQFSPTSRQERVRKRSVSVETSKFRPDVKTIRQHIRRGTVDELTSLFTHVHDDHVTSPRTKEFDFNIKEKVEQLENKLESSSLSQGQNVFPKLKRADAVDDEDFQHRSNYYTQSVEQKKAKLTSRISESILNTDPLPDPKTPGFDYLSASREIFRQVISRNNSLRRNSTEFAKKEGSDNSQAAVTSNRSFEVIEETRALTTSASDDSDFKRLESLEPRVNTVEGLQDTGQDKHSVHAESTGKHESSIFLTTADDYQVSESICGATVNTSLKNDSGVLQTGLFATRSEHSEEEEEKKRAQTVVGELGSGSANISPLLDEFSQAELYMTNTYSHNRQDSRNINEDFKLSHVANVDSTIRQQTGTLDPALGLQGNEKAEDFSISHADTGLGKITAEEELWDSYTAGSSIRSAITGDWTHENEPSMDHVNVIDTGNDLESFKESESKIDTYIGGLHVTEDFVGEEDSFSSAEKEARDEEGDEKEEKLEWLTTQASLPEQTGEVTETDLFAHTHSTTRATQEAGTGIDHHSEGQADIRNDDNTHRVRKRSLSQASSTSSEVSLRQKFDETKLKVDNDAESVKSDNDNFLSILDEIKLNTNLTSDFVGKSRLVKAYLSETVYKPSVNADHDINREDDVSASSRDRNANYVNVQISNSAQGVLSTRKDSISSSDSIGKSHRVSDDISESTRGEHKSVSTLITRGHRDYENVQILNAEKSGREAQYSSVIIGREFSNSARSSVSSQGREIVRESITSQDEAHIFAHELNKDDIEKDLGRRSGSRKSSSSSSNDSDRSRHSLNLEEQQIQTEASISEHALVKEEVDEYLRVGRDVRKDSSSSSSSSVKLSRKGSTDDKTEKYIEGGIFSHNVSLEGDQKDTYAGPSLRKDSSSSDSESVKSHGSKSVKSHRSESVKSHGSESVKSHGSESVKSHGSESVKFHGSESVKSHGSEGALNDPNEHEQNLQEFLNKESRLNREDNESVKSDHSGSVKSNLNGSTHEDFFEHLRSLQDVLNTESGLNKEDDGSVKSYRSGSVKSDRSESVKYHGSGSVKSHHSDNTQENLNEHLRYLQDALDKEDESSKEDNERNVHAELDLRKSYSSSAHSSVKSHRSESTHFHHNEGIKSHDSESVKSHGSASVDSHHSDDVKSHDSGSGAIYQSLFEGTRTVTEPHISEHDKESYLGLSLRRDSLSSASDSTKSHPSERTHGFSEEIKNEYPNVVHDFGEDTFEKESSETLGLRRDSASSASSSVKSRGSSKIHHSQSTNVDLGELVRTENQFQSVALEMGVGVGLGKRRDSSSSESTSVKSYRVDSLHVDEVQQDSVVGLSFRNDSLSSASHSVKSFPVEYVETTDRLIPEINDKKFAHDLNKRESATDSELGIGSRRDSSSSSSSNGTSRHSEHIPEDLNEQRRHELSHGFVTEENVSGLREVSSSSASSSVSDNLNEQIRRQHEALAPRLSIHDSDEARLTFGFDHRPSLSSLDSRKSKDSGKRDQLLLETAFDSQFFDVGNLAARNETPTAISYSQTQFGLESLTENQHVSIDSRSSSDSESTTQGSVFSGDHSFNKNFTPQNSDIKDSSRRSSYQKERRHSSQSIDQLREAQIVSSQRSPLSSAEPQNEDLLPDKEDESHLFSKDKFRALKAAFEQREEERKEAARINVQVKRNSFKSLFSSDPTSPEAEVSRAKYAEKRDIVKQAFVGVTGPARVDSRSTFADLGKPTEYLASRQDNQGLQRRDAEHTDTPSSSDSSAGPDGITRKKKLRKKKNNQPSATTYDWQTEEGSLSNRTSASRDFSSKLSGVRATLKSISVDAENEQTSHRSLLNFDRAISTSGHTENNFDKNNIRSWKTQFTLNEAGENDLFGQAGDKSNLSDSDHSSRKTVSRQESVHSRGSSVRSKGEANAVFARSEEKSSSSDSDSYSERQGVNGHDSSVRSNSSKDSLIAAGEYDYFRQSENIASSQRSDHSENRIKEESSLYHSDTVSDSDIPISYSTPRPLSDNRESKFSSTIVVVGRSGSRPNTDIVLDRPSSTPNADSLIGHSEDKKFIDAGFTRQEGATLTRKDSEESNSSEDSEKQANFINAFLNRLGKNNSYEHDSFSVRGKQEPTIRQVLHDFSPQINRGHSEGRSQSYWSPHLSQQNDLIAAGENDSDSDDSVTRRKQLTLQQASTIHSKSRVVRSVSSHSRRSDDMTAVVGEVSSFAIHKLGNSHEESSSVTSENSSPRNSIAANNQARDETSDIYLIQDRQGELYALQEVDGNTESNKSGLQNNLTARIVNASRPDSKKRAQNNVTTHAVHASRADNSYGNVNGLDSPDSANSKMDFYTSGDTRADFYVDNSAVEEDKAREVISAFLDSQEATSQHRQSNTVYSTGPFNRISTAEQHHSLKHGRNTIDGGLQEPIAAVGKSAGRLILLNNASHDKTDEGGSVLIRQGYGHVNGEASSLSDGYVASGSQKSDVTHPYTSSVTINKEVRTLSDSSQTWENSGFEPNTTERDTGDRHTSTLHITHNNSAPVQQFYVNRNHAPQVFDSLYFPGQSVSFLPSASIRPLSVNVNQDQEQRSAHGGFQITPVTVTTATQAVVGEKIGMHIDFSPTQLTADSITSPSDDDGDNRRYVVRSAVHNSPLTRSFNDTSSETVFSKKDSVAAAGIQERKNRNIVLQSYKGNEPYSSSQSINRSDSLSPVSTDGHLYRVYQGPLAHASRSLSPESMLRTTRQDDQDYYTQQRRGTAISRDIAAGNLYRVRSVPNVLDQTDSFRGRSKAKRSDFYKSNQKSYRISGKTHHSPERFFKNPKLSLRKEDYDTPGYSSDESTSSKRYRTVTKVYINGDKPRSRSPSPATSPARYKISSVQTQSSLNQSREESNTEGGTLYAVRTAHPSSSNKRQESFAFSDIESDPGLRGQARRYRVVGTSDSTIDRRVARSYSSPKLARHKSSEEATILRTQTVQPSRLKNISPSIKTHKTVIQLEIDGNKIKEKQNSEDTVEPLYRVNSVKSDDDDVDSSQYQVKRVRSVGDLTQKRDHQLKVHQPQRTEDSRYMVKDVKASQEATSTKIIVSNETSNDSKMWRTGRSISADRIRRRRSLSSEDGESDLERTGVYDLAPRLTTNSSQRDGNKMYIVNSTVSEGTDIDRHPPGWYKSTIDINQNQPETIQRNKNFVVYNKPNTSFSERQTLNEERNDSQNYRAEKTVYFVREKPSPTRHNKITRISSQSNEVISPDSGQGTEITSSDGENEIRHKFERVERIYEVRKEAELPEHLSEDLNNDLRVLRGKILIQNRLDASTDHDEDDFDENANLFDTSFHLGKDNPLYSSDPDIMASLQREEEIELSRRVNQDITFDTVDSIAHNRGYRTERSQVEAKPKRKQNLSQLLLSKLVNVDSKDIRQTIDVEHHNEEIYGDIDFIHADGERKSSRHTSNFDSVNEKVELTLSQGKAYVIIKVIAERIVPTDYEFNVWRKSQAIVTRQIEIDLLANEQRRRLYTHVMETAGPRGSIEDGRRARGSSYYDTDQLSPQERQLSSMETLKLFSQILDVADGQGDKDHTDMHTRQEMGQLPPSAADLLY